MSQNRYGNVNLPERLDQILEAHPDAILCLDEEWTITWANSLAMQLSQINPEDIGRNHWELYPATLGTEIERTYRRAMQERTREHLEFFYPPFRIWYDLTIVPLPEGGLVFYYQEITGRKAAEEARDSAARQLQQVFDSVADSILILAPDWTFRFANLQAVDLLKAGPLLGEKLFDLFPGNYQEPFFSNYSRTMVERVSTEFEAFYPAPLNCWFRVLARPFEEGSIILFVADISARKQAEAAREEVLETTSDGVIAINRAWTMHFLNRRAKELLFAAGDIVGQSLWSAFPETASEDSPYRRAYLQAMHQRVPARFEAFYAEPLNLWFEVEARPSEDGIVVFFRDVTEQKRSAASLAAQQDLLGSIQRAAGVATWDLDLRTGAMTYGPGSAPVFGRPLDELDHIDKMRATMHPASQLTLDPGILESTASEETVLHEYRMLPPDGSLLWLESRARVVREEGVPTHLRGMAIDITRRKQNEEALVASEARYRVLVDLNPQALWSANPQGQIIYANQGFLDYLGLETPDPDGWLKSFAPEDHERVRSAWAHSVHSGDEYDLEARLLRGSDGEARWWHLRGLPVRDDAGAIVQWLGVANDIHESRTSAEVLRRLQQQTERERAEIETLYKTAPIGLALFDLEEFRYLRLNDRQAAFFNLTPEQVVGRRATDLAPIPGLRAMFEAVAAGTPVINHLLEGELVTRPGEHRYWTVNYFPVYGPDGTIRAISAASLEITQQKKAEAALVQSEKLAAVGRLASSISHEINNPLEAITNLLYLTAMHEELPEDVKAYVHMAQSELSRVSQIATQTLRFHRQAVRPTWVNAGQLVTAVLNLYQGRLNNSGIAIDASFASRRPILCFENDIRQVLNNLIANAIDAMRSGGRLLARAHDVVDRVSGLDAVRITIADTGHGMGEETLKRIFEPFYTTKDLNGTGLGLWISAGIVDRHFGRLAVRSSEHPRHHGTVFSLILPVDRLDEHASLSEQT